MFIIEARLGSSRFKALLHGTLPIFGIDVSCTCPRTTLALLGLGLGHDPPLCLCAQQIPYNVSPLTEIRRPVHAVIHWLGLARLGSEN